MINYHIIDYLATCVITSAYAAAFSIGLSCSFLFIYGKSELQSDEIIARMAWVACELIANLTLLGMSKRTLSRAERQITSGINCIVSYRTIIKGLLLVGAIPVFWITSNSHGPATGKPDLYIMIVLWVSDCALLNMWIILRFEVKLDYVPPNTGALTLAIPLISAPFIVTHVLADPVTNCPVCLDDFSIAGGETPASQLVCGHIFHDECIEKWLLRNNTCPVCRHPCRTSRILNNAS